MLFMPSLCRLSTLPVPCSCKRRPGESSSISFHFWRKVVAARASYFSREMLCKFDQICYLDLWDNSGHERSGWTIRCRHFTLYSWPSSCFISWSRECNFGLLKCFGFHSWMQGMWADLEAPPSGRRGPFSEKSINGAGFFITRKPNREASYTNVPTLCYPWVFSQLTRIVAFQICRYKWLVV